MHRVSLLLLVTGLWSVCRLHSSNFVFDFATICCFAVVALAASAFFPYNCVYIRESATFIVSSPALMDVVLQARRITTLVLLN